MAEPEDPERVRVEHLLSRVAAGEADDAEVTELALYTEDDPALQLRAAQDAREANLSEGWLARLEGDRQVQLVERSTLTRMEQGFGLALFGGGFVVSFVAPALGSGMVTAGLVALIYSFVRVRLRTASTDPYRDVDK